MEPFSNLEVVIRFTNSLYQASCDAFPNCSGEGETPEVALEKLSLAISDFISTVAKDAFKTLLTSDRYTEVLLDTTKGQQEQRRIFSMDPQFTAVSKSFFLKMQPLEAKNQRVSARDIRNFLQNNPDQRLGHVMTGATGDSGVSTRYAREQNHETFVFGFPLSFN